MSADSVSNAISTLATAEIRDAAKTGRITRARNSVRGAILVGLVTGWVAGTIMVLVAAGLGR